METSEKYANGKKFDLSYILAFRPTLVTRSGKEITAEEYTVEELPKNGSAYLCTINATGMDYHHRADGRLYNFQDTVNDLRILDESNTGVRSAGVHITKDEDFKNPCPEMYDVKDFDVAYVLAKQPVLIRRDNATPKSYKARRKNDSSYPIHLQFENDIEYAYYKDGSFITTPSGHDLKMLVRKVAGYTSPSVEAKLPTKDWLELLSAEKISPSNLCQEVVLPSAAEMLAMMSTNTLHMTISKNRNSPKPKEFSLMNTNTLVTLAQSTIPADDLSQYTAGIPDGIRSHIDALKAEEKERTEKAAASEIMSLMKLAQEKIDAAVVHIRALRAQEKAQLKLIQSVKDTLTYGHETSNYLPLVKITNPTALGSQHAELLVIPEDWVPAVEKKAKK